MAVKFNPFTGQLQIDEKGSGGGSSYIDGEVATYNDLPLDGTAALNSAWLVREASGVWPVSRKQAGIYIRTATAGSSRDADYTYAGTMPDVFSDANFTLYDESDSTKNAKFQLSGIATGTTRTITVPNKNVTLDDAGDSRAPTPHASGHAAGVKAHFFGQTVGMTEDVFIRANNVGTAGNITLTFNGSTTIDSAISTWNSANPSNQVTLVSGDGSQTPDNGQSIELEHGVNAGSDPYQSVSATSLTVVGTSDTTPVAVIQGAQWFGSVNGNQGVLYQGDEDGKVKVIALNKAFSAYRSLELVSDGDTFTFPANGGTLALTSDIPAFGTSAGQAAEGNHAHGNLTNDGKLGSTSGLPVVTTTAGAVTTLALGTAGQVLTVNSGATGVEFAAASGGGVTGAAASASDVLGVSGANITGVDANADRIIFWDDSASALKHLTVGSGLSISDTTISATVTGGGTKTYAVFTAEHNQPPSTAFATLDTRNSIAVLDFDAATDENAVFVGIMPEAASLGSGLIVRLHWMATSATSGNVRWGVQFERSNTDLDSDSFDTAVEATAATNGTSGILTTTAITVTTIDGITAGDVFRLKVFRNADDATNDTMTGDAELVAVEVRSAA